MKKLYRFDAHFGRMGSLRGTFVADEKAVEAAIGRRVYFGEVLGKHSEIWIDALKPEHVRPLTDDAAFVAKFEEYGCGSGYNPLSYPAAQRHGAGRRARAETVIRAGIESMVKNAAAGGAGGALGKGLGAAGSLLTIAAIAVTTFTVGSMVVDKMIDDTAKSKTDMMNAGLRKDDVEQTLRAINEGRSITPEALSRAKAYQQEMSMRMTGATEKSGEERAGDVVAMLGGGLLGGIIGGYIESALGGASVSDQGQRFRDREAGSTALAAEMAGIRTTLAGTVKVLVTNPTGGGPAPGGTPTVDPTTRTGPG